VGVESSAMLVSKNDTMSLIVLTLRPMTMFDVNDGQVTCRDKFATLQKDPSSN
jgi:hypothetical protein